MVLPDIGDVFQKQHGQDKVLIGVGADGTSESVTGRPQSLVNSILVDAVVHFVSPLSSNCWNSPSNIISLFFKRRSYSFFPEAEVETDSVFYFVLIRLGQGCLSLTSLFAY